MSDEIFGFSSGASSAGSVSSNSSAPLVECGNSVALGFDTDDIPIGGSLTTTSAIKSDGGQTIATLNSTVQRTGQDAFETTISQSNDPDLSTSEEGN